MKDWEILEADALELLAGIEPESVDAIVTDPPYGLGFMGKEWDSPGGCGDFPMRRSDPINTVNTGVSRQGGRQRSCEDFAKRQARDARSAQEWHFAWATLAIRVLKPGAHLVAFGGTRTYHRLACALEDAGFEIRDSLMWIYGSGFPKSLDVSKAIDRAAGAERQVVGKHPDPRHNYPNTDITGGHYIGGQPATRESGIVTAPTTDAARQWEGWGTALKPSWESVVWATKPLEPCIIDANLCEKGARLWSMLSAKDAAELSESSRRGYEEAFGSAQWSAAEKSNTRDALSARMDTSQFASAILLSLSIVSSWRNTLVALSRDPSTSTTGTVSSTTTDLEILNSSLSQTTLESILAHATSRGGLAFGACPAADAFAAVKSKLNSTHTLSALAAVIGTVPTRPQGGADSIVLARKPLAGTVAANVAEHGCGALNVDGCRVGTAGGTASRGEPNRLNRIYGDGMGGLEIEPLNAGRWPPNVLLTHAADCGDECAEGCPVAEMDRQSGESFTPATVGRGPSRGTAADYTPHKGEVQMWPCHGDSGGASRFFPRFRYEAKASTAERNAGLGAADRVLARSNQAKGRDPIDSGAGAFNEARRVANHHPTVKPIALMRWLCRLVTPPGGLILDPFLGSGTTMIAALREGFRCIGIERDAEYVAIARRRVEEDMPLFRRERKAG